MDNSALIKKLESAKAKGYEIDEVALRRAKRDQKRASRSEPQEPDPLHGIIENLLREIQRESLQRKIETTQLISRVIEALSGLKNIKIEPPNPKKKELEIRDSKGQLKYTVKVREKQ